MTPVASLYFGFLLTGFGTVLLGPLIPELQARWGVSHAEVASLFVAQFAASSVGAVLSSRSLRWSPVVGQASMAAGVLGLAHGGWPLALPAVALLGLGLGLAIPATNLLVAHMYPDRRGASLSTLNFVWGVGAVGCPLLFAALLGRMPTLAALWLLAALAGIAGVSLARAIATPAAPAEPRSPAGGARRASLALLLLLACKLFLYVGVENAIGGWLVALSDQLGGARAAVSMIIGSCFWGALLAGRAGAPILLRRVGEPVLHTASLAVAGAGTAVLLVADSRPGVATGAVIAGLGLAPIFPLTVSLLAAETESTRSREAGWVFAFGGLGGALLPWLTGQVTGEAGLLRHGYVVPATGLVLMAALLGAHRFLSSREPAPPAWAPSSLPPLPDRQGHSNT